MDHRHGARNDEAPATGSQEVRGTGERGAEADGIDAAVDAQEVDEGERVEAGAAVGVDKQGIIVVPVGQDPRGDLLSALGG